MPRSRVAVSGGERVAHNGQFGNWRSEYDTWTERPRSDSSRPAVSVASRPAVPGRRTVTITGQGAEGYASRNGTRPSAAQRHRQVRRHERAGFRPDRAAMWAVLLCVTLVLAAAASSHAAVLAHHLH